MKMLSAWFYLQDVNDTQAKNNQNKSSWVTGFLQDNKSNIGNILNIQEPLQDTQLNYLENVVKNCQSTNPSSLFLSIAHDQELHTYVTMAEGSLTLFSIQCTIVDGIRMTEINDPKQKVLHPQKVSSSQVYLPPHKPELHSILLMGHVLSESVSGHDA